MNISEVDYAVERKKNRQTIFNWKMLAILFGILSVIMFGKFSTTPSIKTSLKPSLISTKDKQYIGSIYIDDVIFENITREKKLKEISENDDIKALIVYVNSPGGTIVGSEKTYNLLRKISNKKPVVAVMGSMATSGAYMISLGADYIICHNGTITGSIGVIMESFEFSELAKKLGIKFTDFKSSKFKGSPSTTKPVTPEIKEYIMENINEAVSYFKKLVAERRKLSKKEINMVANGKIFVGRKALELKLVDKVGCDDDALTWLNEKKNIDKNLNVVKINLKPKQKLVDIILEDLETSFSSFLSKMRSNIMAL